MAVAERYQRQTAAELEQRLQQDLSRVAGGQPISHENIIDQLDRDVAARYLEQLGT